MASGRYREYRQGQGYWELQFRGFPTKRKTSRGKPIRALRRIMAPESARIRTKRHADIWAVRLETLHELAAHGDAPAIVDLLNYGLIDEAAAANLFGGELPADLPKRKPTWETITIEAAALEHPATVRERKRPREFKRHSDDLKKFLCQPSSPRLLHNLSVDQVTAYIERMREERIPRATRNHRLLWLKRAAARGPTYGIADPLAGAKLDPPDDQTSKPERTCDLDQLSRVALYLEGLAPPARKPPDRKTLPLKQRWGKYTAKPGDPRALAAFGLMALCGLSPAEVIRLQVQDYAGGIIHVGFHGAKNQHRRRSLPCPKTVARWIEAAIAGRQGQEPLLRSDSPRGPGRAFSGSGFHHWLSPRLREAIDIDISNKTLRASFATCAIWEIGLEERHVEAFLGHSISRLAPVTNRHYVAAARARDLRPAASKIDAAFRASYRRQKAQLRTQNRNIEEPDSTK